MRAVSYLNPQPFYHYNSVVFWKNKAEVLQIFCWKSFTVVVIKFLCGVM